MPNIVELIIKATDKTHQALNTSIKNLKDMRNAATALRGPMLAAGGATATALAVMTIKSINAADALNKSSQAIGTTVESLSTLNFAADQAGVSTETLATALTKLNKNAFDAVNGGKESAQAFKSIGVEVLGANGALRANEDILLDVAARFQDIPNGAEKSALAMQLFGKSAGPQLIPFLNQGREGIKALQAEARAMGLEISTDTARRAEAFKDALSKLTSVGSAMGNSIMREVLPSLGGLAQSLVESYQQGGTAKQVIEAVAKTIGFLARASVAGAGVIIGAFKAVGDTMAAITAAQVILFTEGPRAALASLKENFGEVKTFVADGIMELNEILNGQNVQIEAPKIPGLDPAEINSQFQKAHQAYQGGWTGIINMTKAAQKNMTAIDRARWNEGVAITARALDTIVGLATAKNKTLAAIGKAAGIAQATIDTYAGANVALRMLGPLGFPAAAAIIAAGLINVAKISGVELAEGGLVTAPTRALIGEAGPEAVIPLDQADLGFGRPVHVSLEIDGKTLFEILHQGQRDGRYSPGLT